MNCGLLVIGADLAADVAGTAAQLALGLRVAGEDPVEVAAIALDGRRRRARARHTRNAAHRRRALGGGIDPGALVSRLRETIGSRTAVVSSAGGLLAPLTARYSARDLARELELPVVLAASAAPDMVNVARLSLESARAAGLAVAALVLTGWPDPPSRVLLDERRLLEAVVPVPVVSRRRARLGTRRPRPRHDAAAPARRGRRGPTARPRVAGESPAAPCAP